MDQRNIEDLMAQVAAGEISADDAAAAVKRLPFADLGFARVDHHRAVRQGLGEVVFGPNKTPEHCAAIIAELLENGPADEPVLITRATPEQIDAVTERNPGFAVYGQTVVWQPAAPRPERIMVITAGTSDLPVADECVAVLAAHGITADRLTDVGVAGLHRLLADVDQVLDATVVVVCAGMDGALASVIGGLTAAPVVAVPTSVGYGAAFDGLTPLLSMLASCASGVSVVGIDNGFGAAYAALRLLNAITSAATGAGTSAAATTTTGAGTSAAATTTTVADGGGAA